MTQVTRNSQQIVRTLELISKPRIAHLKSEYDSQKSNAEKAIILIVDSLLNLSEFNLEFEPDLLDEEREQLNIFKRHLSEETVEDSKRLKLELESKLMDAIDAAEIAQIKINVCEELLIKINSVDVNDDFYILECHNELLQTQIAKYTVTQDPQNTQAQALSKYPSLPPLHHQYGWSLEAPPRTL